MAQLDAQLVRLALQAVRFPDKWQKLLQHIMAVTPAKAAIITLRDRKTCQIVNDDALEREYHSPLIQGFPLEAVTYYLEELRTIDPWAEAQIAHHPHRPTIMSRICHPAKAKDRRFFNWLETGGLRDTVAFELDRVPGHWTAMNLFIENYDSDEGVALLEYCNIHFELLSDAWRSSQYVIRCQQTGQAALNSLSDNAVPACIISHTGEVFLANEVFEALKERGAVRRSGPLARLSLCQNMSIYGTRASEVPDLPRHDAIEALISVHASPFEIDPMYRSKKDSYWLLRFQTSTLPKRETVAYDLGCLTPQERQLFDAISAGNSVQEAGKLIGIQRSRAFDVWNQVKVKLGIRNAHDLRC